MATSLPSPLLEQARRLPVEERRRLVDELWASIEAETAQGPLSAEERLEAHRRNPDAVVSWESARDRILGAS